MISHGEEADDAGDEETDNRTHLGRGADLYHQPIHHPPQHTGHRIDLLMEDDWLIIQQYIADDTTCRTRNAAHDDGHPERLSEREAFLDTCNGEQCQAKRIEHEPRILQRLHPLANKDDRQQRHSRTY